MKKKIVLLSILGLLTAFNLALFAIPWNGGDKDPKCTAGGYGANSCEISYTLLGVTMSCSVSCTAPLYACCFIHWNLDPRCICKSKGSNPS